MNRCKNPVCKGRVLPTSYGKVLQNSAGFCIIQGQEVEDVTEQEIANYIREIRIRLGLTQKQLGELCGYEGRTAVRMVQQWEGCRRPVPIVKLRALASALQVPLEDIIP